MVPSRRLTCSNAQRTLEESSIQVVGIVVVVYPFAAFMSQSPRGQHGDGGWTSFMVPGLRMREVLGDRKSLRDF